MSDLTVVCCVNRLDVLQRCLLASPDWGGADRPRLLLLHGMRDAAEGFARGVEWCSTRWMLMVHQDVWLPPGWFARMSTALRGAQVQFPRLALAGLYGVDGNGCHQGHVWDRGRWLGGPMDGARAVRSVDELLLAVRVDAGLTVSEGLGWHLYGTDLCIRAERAGLDAVVVDAPCEHRASLLREATDRQEFERLSEVAAAFNASARQLATLWPEAMPVQTAVAPVGPDHVLTVPVSPMGWPDA